MTSSGWVWWFLNDSPQRLERFPGLEVHEWFKLLFPMALSLHLPIMIHSSLGPQLLNWPRLSPLPWLTQVTGSPAHVITLLLLDPLESWPSRLEYRSQGQLTFKNWMFYSCPVFSVLEPFSTAWLTSHYDTLHGHHVFSYRVTINAFGVFWVGQDTATFNYSIAHS